MASYTRQEFIDKYGSFIYKQVKGTGIFAGTLIAQAIIESSGKDAEGNYKVGQSKLSQEANNYFGIKDSSDWRGKTYNTKTGEHLNGKDVVVSANFRAYNSAKDSIKDYIKFLQTNPRYTKANVLTAKTVKEQAQRIKNAGYATDPNYADSVNNVYNSVYGLVYGSYLKFKRQEKIKIIAEIALVAGLLFGSLYALKRYK